MVRSAVAAPTRRALAPEAVAQIDVAIGRQPRRAAPRLERRRHEHGHERWRARPDIGVVILGLELAPEGGEVLGQGEPQRHRAHPHGHRTIPYQIGQLGQLGHGRLFGHPFGRDEDHREDRALEVASVLDLVRGRRREAVERLAMDPGMELGRVHLLAEQLDGRDIGQREPGVLGLRTGDTGEQRRGLEADGAVVDPVLQPREPSHPTGERDAGRHARRGHPQRLTIEVVDRLVTERMRQADPLRLERELAQAQVAARELGRERAQRLVEALEARHLRVDEVGVHGWRSGVGGSDVRGWGGG